MNDQEKLMAIAMGLLTRTQLREIVWKETAAENSFQTSREEHTILIARTPYRELSLKVLNKNGRAVQELTLDAKSPDAAVLQELYTIASRQALQVDETLDKLLRDFGL